MLVYIILVYFKSGTVFNPELMFDNKAKCKAYAAYRNVEKPEHVKEYKCLTFKEEINKQLGVKE